MGVPDINDLDRITLRCPKCGQTERAQSVATDPILAARVDLECRRCSPRGGGRPRYFNADGREIAPAWLAARRGVATCPTCHGEDMADGLDEAAIAADCPECDGLGLIVALDHDRLSQASMALHQNGYHDLGEYLDSLWNPGANA